MTPQKIHPISKIDKVAKGVFEAMMKVEGKFEIADLQAAAEAA